MENLGSFEPHFVFIQVKIGRLATQLNTVGHLTRSLNVPIVDLPHANNFTSINFLFYFVFFCADYEQAKEGDEYN